MQIEKVASLTARGCNLDDEGCKLKVATLLLNLQPKHIQRYITGNYHG